MNLYIGMQIVREALRKHLPCVHKYGMVKRTLEDGTKVRYCNKCGLPKYYPWGK